MKRKALMKIVACATLAAMGFSTLAGCSGASVGGGGGDGKDKIKVSIYGGGFGSAWAVKMIDDYNKSSTGKYTFVKIQDYLDDNNTITSKILAGVTQADIYFTDQNDIAQLIRSKKLLDLNTVWNATPDGDGKKIESKIYAADTMKGLWSDTDGTYAIPYTLGVAALTYDYDLFEDAGWFLTDNTTENGLTKGLDGLEGTYDDGLPTTEAEYDDLIEKIRGAKMIPYTLAGAIAGAGCNHIFESVHAKYEGLESYMTSYSYDGNMYFPSTGETQTITPETGWKVYAQSEGRDKGVDFVTDHILKEGYLDNDTKNSIHTEAHERFLFSHNSGLTQIAMSIDGCWWENEARPAFDSDASRHGAQYGFGKRRFGILPVPELAGQHPSSDGKAVYAVNTFGSVFAVKSNSDEKNQAILDFLTYFASNKGLQTFTENVGVIPAYNFDLDENVYNNLSFYGKTYYDMMTAENTIIVMPTVYKYLSELNYISKKAPSRLATTIDNYTYPHMVNAFYAGKTPAKMKAAMKSAWTEAKWAELVAEVL